MIGRTPYRLGIFLLSGIFLSSVVNAEDMMALKTQRPFELEHAEKLDSVSPDEPIQLSFVVKLDPDLLAQTMEQLYGRSAPAKKHFLSSGEFAQRFGLSDKRKTLEAFAQANGLTPDADDRPESMVVHVSGTAETVEKAFRIQLHHYRGADGKIFRSHDSDPMIPTFLAPHLGAILGLSTKAGILLPHYRLEAGPSKSEAATRVLPGPASITGGTGPGGGLAPADIKTIYGLNSSTLNGAGQTVALFELDGYNPADITTYESEFGLSSIPVTPVSVDGTTNLCNGRTCSSQNPTTDPNMVEVELDIQMVAALSPGVSQILVYEGPNTEQGSLDIFNKIAMDNIAKAVSTSWGEPETDLDSTDLSAENQVFQRLAAQGQSVYAASGDDGADDGLSVPTVDDPAAQPFVTGAGGTELSGTVQNPTETVWNDSKGASGGGVSVEWPLPSYQSGVAGTASQTARNVPDISLNADPFSGYSIFVSGSWYFAGGTSACAPLWAAFTALLNQQSTALGVENLGFANPVLYSQAAGSDYHTLFNDITSGNNNVYSAGPGYDNATGLGSFKGNALIGTITGQQPPIPPPPPPVPTLSNVYAFPNPWDVRKNPPSVVTIANVPDGSTVKVFTVSGFHIADLTPAGGIATWNLQNSAGKSVASGLYLYFVDFNSKTFRGEIAVIK